MEKWILEFQILLDGMHIFLICFLSFEARWRCVVIYEKVGKRLIVLDKMKYMKITKWFFLYFFMISY